MKKILTRANGQTICLALVTLAAVGWSCSKQDEPAMNDNSQANGVIAQARSYYESSAAPLTRSVADQTIAIKPLPGDMTPLWDKATATVLSDGTTTWVDVPIEAGITYTAVQGGVHHHEAGVECSNDHTPVQAVQKLSVYISPDGTKQSLVATIVPEADCTAELNGFSSAEGLEGFSGFVSWHDLTGKLVRVARYENGTKTRGVEPNGNNEPEILEVVENAVLYETASMIIQTKNGSTIPCVICGKTNCRYKHIESMHCDDCKNDQTTCSCKRCGLCGKKGSWCHCDDPVEHPYVCEICGRIVCAHLKPDDSNYHPIILPTMHEDMLLDILSDGLTRQQYLQLRGGSNLIDHDYQYAGDEYMHGLYVYGDNSSQSAAYTKMRNYFIYKMQGFIQTNDMYALGEGLHPVLDTYIELQKRVDMLNYYSYDQKLNIVHGMNGGPYVNNPTPCTEAVRYIYNTLLYLPCIATDAEIGAVFDHWVDMVKGDSEPGPLL